MAATSKSDAQERADRIKAFNAELAQLAEENILTLTPEQRDAVDAHHGAVLAQYTAAYDIDRTEQEKHLSWGMRVVSLLGALALAASVLFMFYQFWGRFATTVQVAVLFSAAVASLGATVFAAVKDRSGYFVKLAALVCFACFVLNIFMLGRIFNIAPSDKAFIVWSAFAFLLAYAYDIRLLQVAGICCIAAYLSARTGTLSGTYWLYFGMRPENFFPAAALLFVVPSVIGHGRYSGFVSTYRVSALILLFSPMLVLANYGAVSYLNLAPDIIEDGYQVAGFVLSAAAIAVGVHRHWGEVINTGTVFFAIFLYTKFFDWWWDSMPKYLFFLIVGLTAVLFLLVLKRLRAHGGTAVQRGTV